MVSGTVAGIGYYTSGLISALAAADPGGLELVGHYYNFFGLKHPRLPQAQNISYRVSKLVPRQVVNQLRRWKINIPIELLARIRSDAIIYPASTGPSSL